MQSNIRDQALFGLGDSDYICISTELELCFLVNRTLILDCVDFDEPIWWSKNETPADICEWGKALDSGNVATDTTEISLRCKHHLCLE